MVSLCEPPAAVMEGKVTWIVEPNKRLPVQLEGTGALLSILTLKVNEVMVERPEFLRFTTGVMVLEQAAFPSGGETIASNLASRFFGSAKSK